MLSANHINEETLLRYADGELPSQQLPQVRDHLSSCWHCRAALDELQQVITECARHHQTISDHFPSPPAPWCDIRKGFAQVDAALGSRSFLEKTRQWFSAGFVSRPVRWVPAVAGLAALALIVQQFINVPSAKAAEILRQAVTASESRPNLPRKIEIRARGRNLTRIVAAPLPVTNTAEAAAFAEVESLFKAAHYNWDDPLSARSFNDWRNTLHSKSDEVLTTGAGYEIRTTAENNEITLATLKLRQADMRAIESTLRFRNDDVVEIREIPQDPVLSSVPPAGMSSTRAASPGSAKLEGAPATTSTPASVYEELQVWASLHRIGADLGDPVEVSRDGQHIVVRGIGVPPALQARIRQEFAANSRVDIQFADPASSLPATEPRRVNTPAANPELVKVQEQIARYIGGRASFDQFTDGVLRESESLLSHAHALQRLAQHFPSESESQLSADQRHLLQSLCQDHAETLWQKIAVIQARMNPVLASLGVSNSGVNLDAATSSSGSASWQMETDEILRQARNTDSLLAVMLIGATGDASLERLPQRVSQDLAALKAKISSYRSRRTQ